jgi:hypothetical protein
VKRKPLRLSRPVGARKVFRAGSISTSRVAERGDRDSESMLANSVHPTLRKSFRTYKEGFEIVKGRSRLPCGKSG